MLGAGSGLAWNSDYGKGGRSATAIGLSSALLARETGVLSSVSNAKETEESVQTTRVRDESDPRAPDSY